MKNQCAVCLIIIIFLSALLLVTCKKTERPAAIPADNSYNQDVFVLEPAIDVPDIDISRAAIMPEIEISPKPEKNNATAETPKTNTADVKKQEIGTENALQIIEQPAPEKTVVTQESPALNVPREFVKISGGTFTMGSHSGEQGRTSEESPQRQVTVSLFYIATHPVTQAEYEKVMGENPSIFKGAKLPVEQVDWFDAVDYCNKRSKQEGLTPAYTITVSDNNRTVTWNREANGYRLPTEAEWEYACRAGTVTPFSFGNSINTNLANYNGTNPYDIYVTGEDRKKTTAVGSFAPNSWGLYDMHGNVFEWCWDWFGNYAGRNQEDPAGAVSGTKRVLRGGSWMSSMPQIRSAFRHSAPPSGSREPNIGFRVVHNVP